ncbi:hypothetical protein [Flammeovirga sp. OC4]|uniref:hypothetical protein n=1 Tax=Flammeovirga sp. OC4 TaxID=1382345 RepID=UPI0005C4D308|nr:hypothetical protein [Flammeovirga sp. OC4]
MEYADFQLEKKIKSELKRNGIQIKQLCQKIDLTNDGLNNGLRTGSLKVIKLIDIANFLDLPMNYFFTTKEGDVIVSQDNKSKVKGNHNSINNQRNIESSAIETLNSKIALLEKELEKKEIEIKGKETELSLKDELITLLKQINGNRD